MNIFNYAIVSDFDGTITTKDTNDTIFYEYGNEKSRANEERLIAGLSSYKATMTQHYKLKPLDFEEYYSFIDAHIPIDPGFGAFLQKVQDNNLPFFIVSGGFHQAISRILKDYELPTENIFANSLTFKERLIPIYAHNITNCTTKLGPCGNCKKICIEHIRKQTGKKIMYIGDGFTDHCAIKIADYAFAKGSLIDYCEANNIKHQKFKSFTDITAKLFRE